MSARRSWMSRFCLVASSLPSATIATALVSSCDVWVHLAPSRVVLEATGKLEQLAVSELAAAGLPVVVINPAQVRHYAKARGKWAKTDPIDARLIAEFARDLEPELR